MPNPSRNKQRGSCGERELCKILGEHLGGAFVRTAQSGAFIGGKNAHRKATLSEGQISAFKGDIVPPDHLRKLVVEAKTCSVGFKFHQLLMPGGSPQLNGWVRQVLDTVDPNDVWMIAFKVSRIGWFVVIPDHGPYTWGNCWNYGKLRIAELTSFLRANRHAILERCA